jgi:broad specificity phosphatase PhoE
MLEIVLIRHGETDWNVGQVFRGRADIGLNKTGIRQAELLGEYLSRDRIDFIYSSPLQRAAKTASAIAAYHNLEVNNMSNLIDIDFGEWQGLSLEEVKARYREIYRDWIDTPEQVRVPGGECLEEVRARAMSFVEDAVMRCGEGRIVLVSHRVVCKVLICGLLGVDNSFFPKIRIDNCGVTRFDCGKGRLVLTVHNDTAFLRSMGVVELNDF